MTNEINLTVNDNGNLTFNGVEYAPVVKQEAPKPQPRTGRIKASDDLKGVKYYWLVRFRGIFDYAAGGIESCEIKSGLAFYDQESAQRYFDRRKLQVKELDAAEASWDWGETKKLNGQGYFICWGSLTNKKTSIRLCESLKYKDAQFNTEEAAQAFIDSLTKDEQRLLWG